MFKNYLFINLLPSMQCCIRTYVYYIHSSSIHGVMVDPLILIKQIYKDAKSFYNYMLIMLIIC